MLRATATVLVIMASLCIDAGQSLEASAEPLSPFAAKVSWTRTDPTSKAPVRIATSEGFETTSTSDWVIVPTPQDKRVTITLETGSGASLEQASVDYFLSSAVNAQWEAPVNGLYGNASRWEHDVVPCPDKHAILPSPSASGYAVSLGVNNEYAIQSLVLKRGSTLSLGLSSRIRFPTTAQTQTLPIECPVMKNPSVDLSTWATAIVRWDSIEGNAQTVIIELEDDSDITKHTFELDGLPSSSVLIPDLKGGTRYTVRVFLGQEHSGGLEPRHPQLTTTITTSVQVEWKSDEMGDFEDIAKWHFQDEPLNRLPCPTEHVRLKRESDAGPVPVSVRLHGVTKFRSLTFGKPGARLYLSTKDARFYLMPKHKAEEAAQNMSCALNNATGTVTTSPATTQPSTTVTTAQTTTTVTTADTTAKMSTTEAVSTETVTLRMLANLGESFFASGSNRNNFETSALQAFRAKVGSDDISAVDIVNYASAEPDRRRATAAGSIFDATVTLPNVNTSSGALLEETFCGIRDLLTPDRVNDLSASVGADLGVPLELTMISLQGCDSCVCPDQQIVCPQGTREEDNTCVSALCFANETETSDGGCRDANGDVRYPGCPQGATLVEIVPGVTQCRLKPGCASSSLIYDEANQLCVPRTVGCPTGTIRNIHGDCVLEFAYCGPGQTYSPDKLGPDSSFCMDIDECAEGSDQCVSEATCRNKISTYECRCPPDTSGDGRQDGQGCVHPCEPNPCKFGGSCTIGGGEDGFKCDCLSPYQGSKCQLDATACNDGVCQNGATCRPGPASPDGDHAKANFTCDCTAGFTGDLCSEAVAAVKSDDNMTVIIAAAAAGGAALLLVVLIVVIIVFRRRENPDEFEIGPSDIYWKGKVGSGASGEVYLGEYLPLPGKMVAVKCAADVDDDAARTQFIEEINLMKQIGSHPNVAALFKCCTKQGEDPFLVLHYAKHGSLLLFLRNRRPEKRPRVEDRLVARDFADMCLQIANGMAYLHRKGLVHADLACRNVLVDEGMGSGLTYNVSDFGMSGFIDPASKELQRPEDVKVPIRWTAPEVMRTKKFTYQGDVWSYGVTMWEIFSLGDKPYDDKENAGVQQFAHGGGRLSKPKYCGAKFYKLMMQCWNGRADKRPSFEAIKTTVKRLMEDMNLYEQPARNAANAKNPKTAFEGYSASSEGDSALPPVRHEDRLYVEPLSAMYVEHESATLDETHSESHMGEPIDWSEDEGSGLPALDVAKKRADQNPGGPTSRHNSGIQTTSFVGNDRSVGLDRVDHTSPPLPESGRHGVYDNTGPANEYVVYDLATNSPQSSRGQKGKTRRSSIYNPTEPELIDMTVNPVHSSMAASGGAPVSDRASGTRDKNAHKPDQGEHLYDTADGGDGEHLYDTADGGDGDPANGWEVELPDDIATPDNDGYLDVPEHGETHGLPGAVDEGEVSRRADLEI